MFQPLTTTENCTRPNWHTGNLYVLHVVHLDSILWDVIFWSYRLVGAGNNEIASGASEIFFTSHLLYLPWHEMNRLKDGNECYWIFGCIFKTIWRLWRLKLINKFKLTTSFSCFNIKNINTFQALLADHQANVGGPPLVRGPIEKRWISLQFYVKSI